MIEVLEEHFAPNALCVEFPLSCHGVCACVFGCLCVGVCVYSTERVGDTQDT